jgi:hypothetical protein
VATIFPANNCASKIMRTIPYDPDHASGMALEPLQDHLAGEKLAYGNTRYLYDQLIDGGSTDEVVLEISSAWPQDFLDLRAYLLSKSPCLSVDALKDAMNKEGFPDAIRAEVCIANHDATQKEGFIKWLEHECYQPLPEYMIGNIVASWEVRTYRTALESEMAARHAEMTQAANILLHRHADDDDGAQPSELRAVWQLVRTPAARYAEALTWMEDGDFASAAAVITALPLEHDLKPPEALERQRMQDLIALLAPIHASGRSHAQLTTAEADALEALCGEAYDRPATWISNLLCFHYNRCRPPLTGGEDAGGGKSARQALLQTVAQPAEPHLQLHPNPASAWVALDYNLRALARNATLFVLDATGREVWRATLALSRTQVLWDTRSTAPGAYSVILENAGTRVATERLVLQH